MEKIQLQPKDNYQLQVADENFLNSDWSTVLSTLYLPIIGMKGFSLYQFFFVQQKADLKQFGKHAQILAWLDFGLPEFLATRQKLEAVGLLTSFYHEETFIYQLQAPLNFTEFFHDEIFTQLLVLQVGQQEVQRLIDIFLPAKKKINAYDNISASFQSIFPETLAYLPAESPVKIPETEMMEKTDFDWLFFKEVVEKSGLLVKNLTKEERQNLIQFVQLYGYDELTLGQLVVDTADLAEKTFDFKKLKQTIAADFNQKLQRLSAPKITAKQSAQVENERTSVAGEDRFALLLAKGFTNEEIEFIKACEKIAPLQFLAAIKKQKGGFLANSEKYVVENLLKRRVLPASVINVLIDVVLRQQDRANLSAAYVDAIANTWAQAHITLPEEAIEKARDFSESNQRPTRAKSAGKKKKEPLPTWVDQPVAETTMDEQEQAAFKARIEKLKESR